MTLLIRGLAALICGTTCSNPSINDDATDDTADRGAPFGHSSCCTRKFHETKPKFESVKRSFTLNLSASVLRRLARVVLNGI